jgi:hypothetical protein
MRHRLHYNKMRKSPLQAKQRGKKQNVVRVAYVDALVWFDWVMSLFFSSLPANSTAAAHGV